MILSSSNCNTSNSSHHNTHYHRSNHYTQRCILIIFRPVKYMKCFHISCKLFDKNIQDRANAMKMGWHKLDRIWQWIVVKICRHGKEGKKLEKIKKVFYGSSLIYHHLCIRKSLKHHLRSFGKSSKAKHCIAGPMNRTT